MSANKAIVVASPGNAEIREVPYPVLPQDDYLIVKVLAVAINPTDPGHIDMTGEHSCEGCYVGCDMSGIVVEVGPGVTKDFKKGDRVAGGCNGW
jgi:NADPH:quinone reductase-like Zn-dependent oxidoreductase